MPDDILSPDDMGTLVAHVQANGRPPTFNQAFCQAREGLDALGLPYT